MTIGTRKIPADSCTIFPTAATLESALLIISPPADTATRKNPSLSSSLPLYSSFSLAVSKFPEVSIFTPKVAASVTVIVCCALKVFLPSVISALTTAFPALPAFNTAEASVFPSTDRTDGSLLLKTSRSTYLNITFSDPVIFQRICTFEISPVFIPGLSAKMEMPVNADIETGRTVL